MQPRLRLFNGDVSSIETPQPESPAPQHVSMSLDELAAVLADAAKMNRTWLADFGDEQINIPADLYEIMSAYSQLRPSA